MKVQAGSGGFYSADSAKPILPEVQREHGPAAVDGLIVELALDPTFGLVPGTPFEGGLSIPTSKVY